MWQTNCKYYRLFLMRECAVKYNKKVRWKHKDGAYLNINAIKNFAFSGLIFNKNYNDMLYVIQNGSLLRIDENFESFDIFEHYCLDMDEDEQILTAIVCEFDEAIFRVNRAQALIFATCMIISVPVNYFLLLLSLVFFLFFLISLIISFLTLT